MHKHLKLRMKSTAYRIIPSCVALVMALILACPLCAQDQDPPPDNSQENAGPAPRQFPGHAQRRKRLEERLRQLSQELNLTDEQRHNIRPMLRDELDQLRALRRDTSLSQQDRFAKTQQIRKATRARISQILTPEQKEKLKSIREERQEQGREQHGAPNGNGGDNPTGGGSADNPNQ